MTRNPYPLSTTETWQSSKTFQKENERELFSLMSEKLREIYIFIWEQERIETICGWGPHPLYQSQSLKSIYKIQQSSSFSCHCSFLKFISQSNISSNRIWKTWKQWVQICRLIPFILQICQKSINYTKTSFSILKGFYCKMNLLFS